jgi:hypothetical protein
MSILTAAAQVTGDDGVRHVEMTIEELRIRTSPEVAIIFAAGISLAASSFGTSHPTRRGPSSVTDVLMATSTALETVHSSVRDEAANSSFISWTNDAGLNAVF